MSIPLNPDETGAIKFALGNPEAPVMVIYLTYATSMSDELIASMTQVLSPVVSFTFLSYCTFPPKSFEDVAGLVTNTDAQQDMVNTLNSAFEGAPIIFQRCIFANPDEHIADIARAGVLGVKLQ